MVNLEWLTHTSNENTEKNLPRHKLETQRNFSEKDKRQKIKPGLQKKIMGNWRQAIRKNRKIERSSKSRSARKQKKNLLTKTSWD